MNERRNKYQFICCDGCPLNLYCSFECRDFDFEKHKLECGYSRLLNSAGISYLVYKLLTKRQRNVSFRLLPASYPSEKIILIVWYFGRV